MYRSIAILPFLSARHHGTSAPGSHWGNQQGIARLGTTHIGDAAENSQRRWKKWGEKMDKLGKMVEALGKNLENEWKWWKQENKKMEHMGKVQQNICKHEGNEVKFQQTHWNTWGRHIEILREMQWTYTIFRQLRRWMHVSCFRETYGNLSREMMETSVTQTRRLVCVFYGKLSIKQLGLGVYFWGLLQGGCFSLII